MHNRSHWHIGWEQKSRYQQNLLWSNLIVIVLFAILGVYAYITGSRNGDTSTRRFTLSGASSQATRSDYAGSSGTLPAAVHSRSVRTLPDFSGYIGRIEQVSYGPPAITPNHSRPEGVPLQAPVTQTLATSLPEAIVGYGDGSGDFYGSGIDEFGLPPTSPYLPPPKTDPRYTDLFGGISEYRRAVAHLRSPRFPMRALEFGIDTGVVEVGFVILPDNTIEYDVLYEEPGGFGFGEAVKWALLSSRFRPEIRGGVPHAVRIRLRVLLCRDCSSQLHIKHGRLTAFLDN